MNTLLVGEGFNLIKLNDILSLKNQKGKGGILVVGIDSHNMLEEFVDIFKNTENSWSVLCILEKKINPIFNSSTNDLSAVIVLSIVLLSSMFSKPDTTIDR